MNDSQAKELYSKLGKELRIQGRYWLAQCPNPKHPDRNPSCIISRTSPHPFKCKSCGHSGTLVGLAKDYGMEVDESVDLSTLSDYDVLQLPDLSQLRLEAWTGDYRGVEESVWKHFGAIKWYETFIRETETGPDEEFLAAIRMLLPIYIKGVMLGYVGRRIDEEDERRYNNFKGANFNSLWYPYDMCQPTHPIVIVEGPMDAIRCWMNQIPALCMFGVSSWSTKKLALLLEKNPSSITLCLDGDAAGSQAQAKLQNILKRYFDVQTVQLPDGNDPFDLAPELLAEIRDLVWNHHFEKYPQPIG